VPDEKPRRRRDGAHSTVPSLPYSHDRSFIKPNISVN
jgi:hypothetical protein